MSLDCKLETFKGALPQYISKELERQLKERASSNIEVLDGDEIRRELNWDLGFSKEDRITNLKRIAYTKKSRKPCHLGRG